MLSYHATPDIPTFTDTNIKYLLKIVICRTTDNGYFAASYHTISEAFRHSMPRMTMHIIVGIFEPLLSDLTMSAGFLSTYSINSLTCLAWYSLRCCGSCGSRRGGRNWRLRLESDLQLLHCSTQSSISHLTADSSVDKTPLGIVNFYP